MSDMTSSRPYLLRAIYAWIVDNGLTPYLLVNAEHDDVAVPLEHVSNGKIILNAAPEAVQSLELGDEAVSFQARFSGQPMHIYLPVSAIQAIYARENGRVMVFSDEDDQPPEPEKPRREKSAQPTLRVVK